MNKIVLAESKIQEDVALDKLKSYRVSQNICKFPGHADHNIRTILIGVHYGDKCHINDAVLPKIYKYSGIPCIGKSLV